MFSQSDTSLKFLYHLIRSDNQMPLGYCKLAHSRKAMHFAGIFIPEQSGRLPVAQRQIPIRMLCCFINIILELFMGRK